jgi:hypothetical protein
VEVDVVSLAAEFPNDNPALHCGVSWVCLELTGAPTAIHELREESAPSMSVAELLTAAEPVVESLPAEPEIPPARISGIVGLGDTPREESEQEFVPSDTRDDEDYGDDEPIVVEDLPPLDETATLEGIAPAAELARAPTTTIAPPPSDDPWLMLVSALADVAIGAGSPHVASVLPGLLLDGALEGMPNEATQALAEADVVRDSVVTARFIAQTQAWRGILDGTSDDFAACGNAMLDEWAADLLARLLGAPSRAMALKSELRSHGVAAFGLAA